jgi:cystathionine beta-lyase/cystathionine gamma-synthase
MSAKKSFTALGASTRAVHLGNKPCEITGAVVQPLILASTFRQPEPNVPLRESRAYAI